MKPESFIFIGRAGSGKGTQAKLLMEVLGRQQNPLKTLYVETGAEFRKIAQGDNYIAKRTKKTIDEGSLMPVFMCVYAWGDIIASEYSGNEHMIFDGTPRKLEEAKMLESVFPFFELPKPWVIYLDVEHEESTSRLSQRAKTQGRVDDAPHAIERRLHLFETEIKPTVEWYRSHSGVQFLDIDGEGKIEDIHAEIVKKIGLK